MSTNEHKLHQNCLRVWRRIGAKSFYLKNGLILIIRANLLNAPRLITGHDAKSWHALYYFQRSGFPASALSFYILLRATPDQIFAHNFAKIACVLSEIVFVYNLYLICFVRIELLHITKIRPPRCSSPLFLPIKHTSLKSAFSSELKIIGRCLQHALNI